MPSNVEGMNNCIAFFGSAGEYGEFSNWYYFDNPISNGFRTVEHAMMYAKAKLFNDKDIMKEILQNANENNPKYIKSLGRKIKGFDDYVWMMFRENVVTFACLEKFRENPKLKELLLSTGHATLVEASPYDNIWGCGYSKDDPDFLDRDKWGSNLLGAALNRVRYILSEKLKG